MEPTILFAARLMPPKVIGGQERLSADILEALQGLHPIIDLANRRGKASQIPYLAALAPRLRWHGRRNPGSLALGSDASLAGPLVVSGVRSILRVNGLDLLYPNPLYQKILRTYLPRIDQVVAISNPTAELAVKAGADPERITVIHPAAEAPPGWKPEPEKGRILHVGRLVPRKGVPEFIKDVWPLVLKEVPEARFDIVGDGPDRERVLEVISAAPGKDRIKWHGKVNTASLERLFRHADVFIMNNQATTNDWEGFGIVAIEAAVRGIPTLGRRVDGVVDAVSTQDAGHLVEPGDEAGFAEVIVSVVLGRTLGDRTRIQRISGQRWSNSRVRGQYAALFKGGV